MLQGNIDNIMTKNVIKLDINEKLGKAGELMMRNGIGKLVITKEGRPVGILELWKIVPADRNKRISEVELSPLPVVAHGAKLEKVRDTLLSNPAVAVVDRTNPKRILGVATAKDLLKLD